MATTQQAGQLGSAGATVAADQKAEAEKKAKSSSEQIPSICIQPFYDSQARYVSVDQTYVWQSEELPNDPGEYSVYPWPLLRPLDETLADDLRKEWQEYEKANKAKANAAAATRAKLRSLIEDE